MTRFRIASLLLLSVLVSGCGYSGRQGEAIGQAKKVTRVTNLLCEDYDAFDVSLGVMQNGTGSVSTQDVWYTVYDVRLLDKLRDFAVRGAIVRVSYDTRRCPFCTEKYVLLGAEEVRQ